jgi:hypothetical protein
MAEKNPSQTQQVAIDEWKKAVEAQVTRVQAFNDELARFEQKGLEHMKTAIEESNKLARESMAYIAQLSAEWRKLALEATRRAADAMSPRA